MDNHTKWYSRGQLNFNFADGFLLSIKMAVFVDGNGKMNLSSMKRAVFVDGVRDICYICMI